MDRASQPARTGLTDRLAPDIARINFTVLPVAGTEPAERAAGAVPTAPPPMRCAFRPHPGMGFPGQQAKNVERDVRNPTRHPRCAPPRPVRMRTPLPTYLTTLPSVMTGHDVRWRFSIFLTTALSPSTASHLAQNITTRRRLKQCRDEHFLPFANLTGLVFPAAEPYRHAGIPRFLAPFSGDASAGRAMAEGVTAPEGTVCPAGRKRWWCLTIRSFRYSPGPAGLSKSTHQPENANAAGAYRYRRQQPVAAETVYRRCRRSTWLAARRATAQRFAGAAARLSGLALSGPSATDAARQPVACCQTGKTAVQISRTGILRASFAAPATGTVTVSLGRYQGLIPAFSIRNRESMTHVSYSF